LLKEAGYPNGFDAGEITSGPPYHSLAEGVANYTLNVYNLHFFKSLKS
jgi:hypothetical protein